MQTPWEKGPGLTGNVWYWCPRKTSYTIYLLTNVYCIQGIVRSTSQATQVEENTRFAVIRSHHGGIVKPACTRFQNNCVLSSKLPSHTPYSLHSCWYEGFFLVIASLISLLIPVPYFGIILLFKSILIFGKLSLSPCFPSFAISFLVRIIMI